MQVTPMIRGRRINMSSRIKECRRKQKNFCTELSAGIFVEFRKRKDRLIENNITRDVNTSSRYVKTLVTLMKWAIPDECTPGRTELKFVFIERTKIRPNCAPKNTKEGVVRCNVEKTL